ncbi:MAG: galactose ABC transporter substrate-binding protein [Eubacteriales bacterium]|nr:galactose ABC transporter substrate-binding protein [Eubacteriales bacterium]
MKKLLSMVLALTLVLSLSGVAMAEGNTQVFWYSLSDVYLSNVRTSLNADFTAAGIEFVDQDANATQTTQTDQITTAIATGTDLLCVNIVETGADGIAQNVVDQAKAAGIPLLFFNRSISEDVVKSYDKCCFIGTNYEDAGIMQGNMIGDYLLADYEKYDLNGDGEISYIMFKGDEANQEAIARTKYGVENADAKLTAAGKPQLKFYDDSNAQKYLVDQNGTWSRQVAQDYMTTVLAQYTEANGNMVELVIANNDEMAIGAVTALQQVGYNNGEGTVTIPVFGVDATPDAVENYMKPGFMAGSIKQDYEGMAEAICTISQNMIAGTDMFANLNENFTVTDGWKVVIPYAMYTGE